MREEIIRMAREAGGGLSCIAEPLEHPWKFTETELLRFAALVAAAEKRKAEVYAAERDRARDNYESAVRLLTGIHALLYPPRFTDKDGRTWKFKSPLVEEQMQELSDRIRALPDDIAAIRALP